MAKPSLALIPSAVGDGTLYSVLPSSGVGDFDFSRSGAATRVNAQGFIETVDNNTPRLNYPLIDGEVSGCPSLLLEPQSRNLVQYSEDWTNQLINPTATSNSTLNPKGVSVNSFYGFSVTETITIASNQDTTVSVFAKKSNWNFLEVRTTNFDASANARTYFDLNNGVVGSTDVPANHYNQKIEYYGNGWYRCGLTFKSVTDVSGLIQLSARQSDLSTTNGVSDTEDIFFDMQQLEQQSYATSYIPTNGTAITRSAETCNNSGDADTFNDSEGVLMAEISALYEDGSHRYISLSDGTNNNRLNIRYISGGNNFIGMFVKIGGTIQVSVSYNKDITINSKVVLKYKLNDYALWIDGFEVGTDLNALVPTDGTLNELKFSNGNGNDKFYGNTKQIQYYDTALTDSELEYMTSYRSLNELVTELNLNTL